MTGKLMAGKLKAWKPMVLHALLWFVYLQHLQR
jgi:hypothetical protein